MNTRATSPSGTFLTDDELREFTGYRRGYYQIKALQSMGIRHYVNPLGQPLVKHSWIDGEQSRPTWDPDYNAIDG